MKGLIEMKFTPEVIAALQVLKDNAENDFERHRISVLEQDLTEPPKVEQFDETHQKFADIKFVLSNSGHYAKSCYAIHQAVWIYHFGEIPEGYEIHHCDGDKSNNDIYNLQLLTKAEHRKIHFSKPKLRKKFEKIFECNYCHKKFVAIDSGNNRFCSSECRSAFFYRQEKNQVERTCVHCGKLFTTNKYNSTKCCSSSCARKLAVQQKKFLALFVVKNFLEQKNQIKSIALKIVMKRLPVKNALKSAFVLIVGNRLKRGNIQKPNAVQSLVALSGAIPRKKNYHKSKFFETVAVFLLLSNVFLLPE